MLAAPSPAFRETLSTSAEIADGAGDAGGDGSGKTAFDGGGDRQPLVPVVLGIERDHDVGRCLRQIAGPPPFIRPDRHQVQVKSDLFLKLTGGAIGDWLGWEAGARRWRPSPVALVVGDGTGAVQHQHLQVGGAPANDDRCSVRAIGGPNAVLARMLLHRSCAVEERGPAHQVMTEGAMASVDLRNPTPRRGRSRNGGRLGGCAH